ncbi:phosphotransferase family protein [Carnobacterium alterfunditum]|uniref:phosphotransferase family protein n=1 Tax=Carnobacterium alterfunditum TaxID=28230 RepID=UPI0035941FC7
MDFEIDSGWKLHPVGGDTGQAYMGTRAEEKLFLKRNSSPFLAALSVEGITPRLMWTKRIGNGDVLTAQEWLNGRVLTKKEMSSPEVAKLIGRIHNSATLRRMLARVGGEVVTPKQLIQKYEEKLSLDLQDHPLLSVILKKLKSEVDLMSTVETKVCHGDIYRKNWLLSDQNRLYLVDWDSAMLCDPAMDVSMLLCQYVSKDSWVDWLEHYDTEMTEELKSRIVWYALMNYLLQTKKHHQDTWFHEMNKDIIMLQSLYQGKNFFEKR